MQLIQTGVNDPSKRRVLLHLVDATDGITPETGEAGTKCKISINYAAPTNTVNSLVAFDTTNAPGDYYLELALSEIQNPGILVIRYKSANTAHFVQEAQVVAFDPETWRGPLVGGGGPDIDYKRIKKLIDDAVDAIPKPEIQKIDLQPIVNGLEALQKKVSAIKLPEIPKTDLRPIEKQLETLEALIKSIKIPETDFTETHSLIKSQEKILKAIVKLQEGIKNGQIDRIREFFEEDVDQIKEAVLSLHKQCAQIEYIIPAKQPKEEPQVKPSAIDEYLNLP